MDSIFFKHKKYNVKDISNSMARITVFDTIPDADHFVGLLKIWDIVKSYDLIVKYADSLGFDKEDVTEGYIYFIDTWLRAFLDSIMTSTHVLLEDNYEFYRANYQGVHISKMSNSCDKIIFIRNYHKFMRALKKDKKRSVYTVMARFDNFISKFTLKFKKIICENDDLSIIEKDRIQFATISRGLFLFNQITKGIPQGRFFTLFKTGVTKKELESNFLGYKITLLYVWKKCLTKKQFGVVEGIKDALYWSGETYSGEYSSGDTIDCFFRKIVDGIIEPLKKKKNTDLSLDVYFLFKKSMPKGVFNSFLEDASPDLNEKEKIDELFLWYNCELTDSSKSYVFNGAMSFIILLEGSVSWGKRVGKKSPVRVLKIPHKNEHGYDYSYGILIESGGSFGSDFSGWMVFYDVCTDYSGFGGQQHAYIEGMIKLHLRNKSITIREKEMSLEYLEKYLSEKSTDRRIGQVKKEYEKKNEILNEARGILLELIVYYLQTQIKDNNVRWGIELENGEIDILVETIDSIKFIECKIDAKSLNLDKEIKKIKEKKETYESIKQKSAEFWFWNEVDHAETKKKLKDEKIGYIVLPEKLKNLPYSRKINTRISLILNYEN